ncbi:hypothetical protein ABZT03_44335 [Streptomyces sp. NPDC005574]|uniref:hypothetical protein n=1 Tax=Streptomyces sp. NPDC005574 TaxID=3156891 RepID=UPI0033AE1CCD
MKHIPILDLIVLASGFVLRVILGAVVVGVSISSYFLIVTAFGSLFMVAGKRAAELNALGQEAAAHRPILHGPGVVV